MHHRQKGVSQEHPGTRIYHHLADFHAHICLIAVHGAMGAGGLVFLERAALQAEERIILEGLAAGAKLTVPRSMPVVTVYGGHASNRFSLPPDPGMLVIHVCAQSRPDPFLGHVGTAIFILILTGHRPD